MHGIAAILALWMAAAMPATSQTSCRQLDDGPGQKIYPVLRFFCEGEDPNCNCRLTEAAYDCREANCSQLPWPCGRWRCFRYKIEQLQKTDGNCSNSIKCDSNSSCKAVLLSISNNCSSINFSDPVKTDTTLMFLVDVPLGFEANSSNILEKNSNESSLLVFKVVDDGVDKINRTTREVERIFTCQEQLTNISHIISINRSIVRYDVVEDNEYLVICTKVKAKRRSIWGKVPLTPLVVMFVGVSVSLICLLLTAIVTFVLGEHRSVPGFNLICLTASLFVAYSCVPVGVLSGIWHRENVCRIAGIFHVYSLISTIVWMNVMAFDIWRSLSAMEPVGRYTSKEYRWLVFSYSMYAWGVPAVLVLTGCILDNTDSIPEDFKPHFAYRCWFKDKITKGTILLYHVPISFILVANLVFFVCTARIFWAARQAQTTTMTVHDTNCRYSLGLYVKLFLVMGLTWVMESVSMTVQPDVLRTISDFINTLHGLFIFLIFCCKRRVFERMKQRVLRGGRGGLSLTSTPSTILRYQGSVRSDMSVRLSIPNGNTLTLADNPKAKPQIKPADL